MPQSSPSWDQVFISSPHESRWMLWGDLPDADATQLEAQLRVGAVSPPEFETNWLAIAQNPDGSIYAAASAMVMAGFFWTTDTDASGHTRLLISAGPQGVILQRNTRTALNEEFFQPFLLGGADPRSTPYMGVHRVQAGLTAHWASPDATPREIPWNNFDLSAKPTLEGPPAMEAYLHTFDKALSHAMGDSSPLVTTLSGGLDSSFMVGSMALQTTPDRPIHAFTHRPHPDAQLTPLSVWDPDDSNFALTMKKMYPDRVTVTTVFNEDRVQPLDAARIAAERSWWPTFNPANQIWIDEFERRALDLGANKLFMGMKGNSSFSCEPHYAAEYYLRRFRLDKLIQLSLPHEEDETSLLKSVRYRVLGPLKTRALKSKASAETFSLRSISLTYDSNEGTQLSLSHREGYVQWLNPQSAVHVGAANLPGEIVSLVDPFTAASVLSIAAKITPLEWSKGQFPRGFARRAGAGRVPDEIRSRTRRGGQSWDSWFIIRQAKQRYLDEVALLSSTPGFASWVDPRQVAHAVTAWFDNPNGEPGQVEIHLITRVLATAEFARMTAARLATLK